MSAPPASAAAAASPASVVDDATPGRFDAASSWAVSAWSTQRYSSGYHFAQPSARDDYALFRVATPVTGRYAVFGWWPADRGYNTATQIRIVTREGVRHVVVNQSVGGGRWTKLGSFRFDAGDGWIIGISTRSQAPGLVIADAFRFELITREVPGVAQATLRLGDRGPSVRELQNRLIRLRYLPSGAQTGQFDAPTWHAVVAFQGWRLLARDGVVGPATRSALALAGRPQPWAAAARALELDLKRQVLLLVLNGEVVRAIHVSTAAPGFHTPTGTFRVYRRELRSWSYQYRVWLPYALYFQEGHAFHGYHSVPSYPASHGCVRMPLADAPSVYAFAPLQTPVYVR